MNRTNSPYIRTSIHKPSTDARRDRRVFQVLGLAEEADQTSIVSITTVAADDPRAAWVAGATEAIQAAALLYADAEIPDLHLDVVEYGPWPDTGLKPADVKLDGKWGGTP